jgi:ech hydrogenase subunit E
MGKRTIIPFGPQHPVLPEPIHLDLVVEDETVVEAIPSIGFIHRGFNWWKKGITEMVCYRKNLRICASATASYCAAVEAHGYQFERAII